MAHANARAVTSARWRLSAGIGIVAAMLTAGAAFADPPEGKGKGHGKKGNDGGQTVVNRNTTVNFVFSERDRVVIHDHYGPMIERGHCPPGLQKKHNGCMPPGQAKKWTIGRPLPRDVVFYALPPPLTVHLSVPPPGYRYVRVATDILLIAAGTGMVAAAIEDLVRQ